MCFSIGRIIIIIFLFLIFRKENIGVVGIIRSSGIDFPALFIILRKKWSINLGWGITYIDEVNNVLYIGW